MGVFYKPLAEIPGALPPAPYRLHPAVLPVPVRSVPAQSPIPSPRDPQPHVTPPPEDPRSTGSIADADLDVSLYPPATTFPG